MDGSARNRDSRDERNRHSLADASKLGIGFCDHNYERKIGLASFEGLRQFAREVHATVTSPVWKRLPRRRALALQPPVERTTPAGCSGVCPTCPVPDCPPQAAEEDSLRTESPPVSSTPSFVASRHACKSCTPLGARLARAGVQGARTLLHGSQGRATSIRRYRTRHFKEPVAIASSNLPPKSF